MRIMTIDDEESDNIDRLNSAWLVTSWEVWILVAEYVDSNDLYSACLVCQLWWQIFSPWLWANPASHFGSDSDAIYRELSTILVLSR